MPEPHDPLKRLERSTRKAELWIRITIVFASLAAICAFIRLLGDLFGLMHK